MILSLPLFLLGLTGCWDRAELPEKGFVMGVAIDQTEEGKIALNTQIFKPSQGGIKSSAGTETTYLNVTTENDTVSKAIRDIPSNLGRKAQWSHMSLIIIGEELARKQNINNVLEFFYRDHEPRLTLSIMIAEGRADQYLKIKPLIGNSTSQQIFRSAEATATDTGKTIFTNLLDMGLQLKSEVGNTLVPYIYFPDKQPKVTQVAGVALIKKGMLVGRMEPKKVEALQIIMGKYINGMMDIPCQKIGNSDRKLDVVEVLDLHSRLQPTIISQNSMKVLVKIQMEVSISELNCSKIKTAVDERKFTENIEAVLEDNIEETVEWLKQKKFDALGLGNMVYKKNPSLWREMKPDWDNQFARTQFEYDVKVKVINSGTVIPQPALIK